MEGAKEVVLECLPQSHLRCDAAIKKLVLDVASVHSLGSGCQSQELKRLEVVNDPAVGRCYAVVELVDDDDIEVFGCEALQGTGVQ